jgi:hypothetical protein
MKWAGSGIYVEGGVRVIDQFCEGVNTSLSFFDYLTRMGLGGRNELS